MTMHDTVSWIARLRLAASRPGPQPSSATKTLGPCQGGKSTVGELWLRGSRLPEHRGGA